MEVKAEPLKLNSFQAVSLRIYENKEVGEFNYSDTFFYEICSNSSSNCITGTSASGVVSNSKVKAGTLFVKAKSCIREARVIESLRSEREDMIESRISSNKEKDSYYCTDFTRSQKPVIIKNQLALTSSRDGLAEKYKKLYRKKQLYEERFKATAKRLFNSLQKHEPSSQAIAAKK